MSCNPLSLLADDLVGAIVDFLLFSEDLHALLRLRRSCRRFASVVTLQRWSVTMMLKNSVIVRTPSGTVRAIAYPRACVPPFCIDFCLPSDVTAIAKYAFAKASHLKRLDLYSYKSLTSIGHGAFFLARATELHLPKNVMEIAAYAFANAEPSVVSMPTSIISIGSCAFAHAKLGTLDLSCCTGLVCVGAKAFLWSPLTSLALPRSLVSIEAFAFFGARLTALDLSQCVALVSIGEGAFFSSGLTTLTFPRCGSLTSIGCRAFFAYRGQAVWLPPSVTFVHARAFSTKSKVQQGTLTGPPPWAAHA